jgi:hypothetical protein
MCYRIWTVPHREQFTVVTASPWGIVFAAKLTNLAKRPHRQCAGR